MSEPPLSPEARLEALLYQYLNLYERWSEDRQSFAQKGEALSALLAAVQTGVGQLGPKVRKLRFPPQGRYLYS